MNIVVLDGYTLNPGDISWEALARLGKLTVHERTAAAEILPRAREAEVLLTNKTPLTAETIAALPRLKFIAVLATGYNVVDVAAARGRAAELGGAVPVSNVPEYSTDSVAQLVIALLLELCHHAGEHSRKIHGGEWGRREWCFWDTPLVELAGKTMGIAGFGRIGRRVGAIADALGMKVLAHSRRGAVGPAVAGLAYAVEWVGLEELFGRADVVSLHMPLTEQTRGVVNEAMLGRMKREAYLINTGRGPLVDEGALAAALREGRIAGAGMDVASVEPMPAGSALLGAPNCVITPHYGWATLAARRRLMAEAAENVAGFAAGRLRNVVN